MANSASASGSFSKRFWASCMFTRFSPKGVRSSGSCCSWLFEASILTASQVPARKQGGPTKPCRTCPRPCHAAVLSNHWNWNQLLWGSDQSNQLPALISDGTSAAPMQPCFCWSCVRSLKLLGNSLSLGKFSRPVSVGNGAASEKSPNQWQSLTYGQPA